MQDINQTDKGLVAGLMAESVVETLEVIKIDVRQRHRESAAPCPRQFTLAGFVETAAIQRTSQRIGARHFTRFGQRFFQLGDAQFRSQQLELSVIGNRLAPEIRFYN